MITAKNWRTLRDYSQKHDLRIQLSIPSQGKFTFFDRGGKVVNAYLSAMEKELAEAKKQETHK